MSRLAFIDLETTGLRPDLHEAWEIGLIYRHHDGAVDEEHRWFLPVDITKATPTALQISGYHRRHPAGYRYAGGFPISIGRDHGLTDPAHATRDIARLLFAEEDKVHLVGNVPWFDEQFMDRLLRSTGRIPEWHYHLITVEALAIGYIAGATRLPDEQLPSLEPPWSSDQLGKLLGVPPASREDRHTALGDARWARDWYDKVMGTTSIVEAEIVEEDDPF